MDAHTAGVLEGARIVKVTDSGTLVVEKDGRTTDVLISGYESGPGAVVVELTARSRQANRRALAYH